MSNSKEQLKHIERADFADKFRRILLYQPQEK